MRISRSLLLAVALTAGCRTVTPYDVDPNAPQTVGLDVSNEHLLSMDVYAVSNNVATRIGRVKGLDKASFILQPTTYVSSDFRVVATPMNGTGVASSGALQVHSGQTVEFTIASRLAASHASIYEPDRSEPADTVKRTPVR